MHVLEGQQRRAGQPEREDEDQEEGEHVYTHEVAQQRAIRGE